MFTTVFYTSTLPSAPGTEQGARRHNRGFLRGSPDAAGLSPLLFLSRRSGRHLRRWVQHNLGQGVSGMSGRARAWLSRWWWGFCWLLSWCHFGATRSGCRAGALGQEVSYCLGRLLCSCEALSEALYCRTKQASG